jgi:acyl carrier protein
MDTLKHIFSSILGVSAETITNDLSPENTSTWDSLNAIILLTEIERAFSVKFTYDEAMAVKNFGEAIVLVRSKGVSL